MLWILVYMAIGVGIWAACCYAGNVERYNAVDALLGFALGWPLVGLGYSAVWLVQRIEDAADWLNAAGVRRSAQRKAP